MAQEYVTTNQFEILNTCLIIFCFCVCKFDLYVYMYKVVCQSNNFCLSDKLINTRDEMSRHNFVAKLEPRNHTGRL